MQNQQDTMSHPAQQALDDVAVLDHVSRHAWRIAKRVADERGLERPTPEILGAAMTVAIEAVHGKLGHDPTSTQPLL